MLTRVRLWLRSVLLRGRFERDMQEEMRAHLERAAARLEATGVPADEARTEATREFGNVGAIQEQARDARGGRGVETLLADVRHAFRHFRRTPVTALTMVIIFAVGIGFNAVNFAVLRSFTSRAPTGVTTDDSMVRIRGIERARERPIGREFSYPEFRDYAAATGTFSAVGAWTSSDTVLQADSGGAIHSGAVSYVTPGFFPVLNVRPMRGQGLPIVDRADARGDAASDAVAVISDVVFERVFDRAPDIVGRTVTVNSIPVTIVGVAPRGFNGVRTGASRMRVWLPLGARPVVQPASPSLIEDRTTAVFGLVATLAPGVEPGAATPVVQTIAARSSALLDPPRTPGVLTSDVVPLFQNNYFPPSGEGPDALSRVTQLLIPILVMLITCTNVSALLAGLGSRRRQEIAVRLSLGASRGRIVRQLLTESIMLALVAGLFASLVVWLLLRVFETSIEGTEVALDAWGVAYTAAIAMLAGVIFGTSPALNATRLALADALKNTAGSVAARSRLQAALVVAQITLTQPALLAMGSLVLEMAAELRGVPSPIYGDRIVDIQFNTNPRYGAMTPEREATVARLERTLAALPDVVGVVRQDAHDDDLRIEGLLSRSGGDTEMQAQGAPPGYFDVVGMPVVRGRDFRSGDAGTGVVIVGTRAAALLWGGADPIGREIRAFSGHRQQAVTLTVVGVVDEVAAGFTGEDGRERVFVPEVRATGHLRLRTRVPADAVVEGVRLAAAAEARELPIVGVRSLRAREAEQRQSLYQIVGMAAGAGLLALFLSAVGLYAAVAFLVADRVREIGIRSALGADERRVVGLFVRRGLRLAAIGLAGGLVMSFMFVRLMALARDVETSGDLYGVAAGVSALVIAAAAFASWIPARRAARVDPLAALRMD